MASSATQILKSANRENEGIHFMFNVVDFQASNHPDRSTTSKLYSPPACTANCSWKVELNAFSTFSPPDNLPRKM